MIEQETYNNLDLYEVQMVALATQLEASKELVNCLSKLSAGAPSTGGGLYKPTGPEEWQYPHVGNTKVVRGKT